MSQTSERKSPAASENADPAILLGVLSAVEADFKTTQRKLSGDLGIALGLANAYLKRCVRKGWVKVSHVPMRRYAYYLTPQGFKEKARLTSEYLTISLDFFRQARNECAELFTAAKARKARRFVLIGAGDLAEVVVLSAIEADVEIMAIVDLSGEHSRCAGQAVLSSIEELVAHMKAGGAKADAMLVTSLESFERVGDIAAALAIEPTSENLLLPSMLKLRWADAEDEE
jgi:DNA-binding MarR family transcriptional regulator